MLAGSDAGEKQAPSLRRSGGGIVAVERNRRAAVERRAYDAAGVIEARADIDIVLLVSGKVLFRSQ